MSQRPHTVHNGNRNLSHDESEELLSARQDAPIDPVENRALLAHLQGCASCRAFAIQLEVMSRELETLPRLAASPTVRREVHDRIQAPQPFWSRLTTSSSSGGMRAVPAALSALVVLVALAAFVMIRLGDSEPGGVANDPEAIDAPIDQALVLSPVATATVDSQAALMEEIPVEPTATARVVTVNTSTPESTETTTASSALEPRDAATGASSASEPDPSATGTAAPTRTPPGLTSRPGEDGEPEPTPAPSSTATSAPQLAQVTQTPDVDSILAAALGPLQTQEPGAAAAGAGALSNLGAGGDGGAVVRGGHAASIAAASYPGQPRARAEMVTDRAPVECSSLVHLSFTRRPTRRHPFPLRSAANPTRATDQEAIAHVLPPPRPASRRWPLARHRPRRLRQQ